MGYADPMGRARRSDNFAPSGIVFFPVYLSPCGSPALLAVARADSEAPVMRTLVMCNVPRAGQRLD